MHFFIHSKTMYSKRHSVGTLFYLSSFFFNFFIFFIFFFFTFFQYILIFSRLFSTLSPQNISIRLLHWTNLISDLNRHFPPTKEATKIMFQLVQLISLLWYRNHNCTKFECAKKVKKTRRRTCKRKTNPKLMNGNAVEWKVLMKYCMTCLIIDLFVFNSIKQTWDLSRKKNPSMFFFSFRIPRRTKIVMNEAYACECNFSFWNQLTVRRLNIVFLFCILLFFLHKI